MITVPGPWDGDGAEIVDEFVESVAKVFRTVAARAKRPHRVEPVRLSDFPEAEMSSSHCL